MSGPSFRFSSEFSDLSVDNKDFFGPVRQLKDDPDLKGQATGVKPTLRDPQARSEARTLPNGDVEITHIYPIDDNDNKDDGRIHQRDTFVFDGKTKKFKGAKQGFKREFILFSDQGDGKQKKSWEEKLKTFQEHAGISKDGKSPGEGKYRPTEEQVTRFAQKVARSYVRPFNLNPAFWAELMKKEEGKDDRTYLVSIGEQADEIIDYGFATKIRDQGSYYTVIHREDAIEIIIGVVVDNDLEDENGRLLAKDHFVLDPKTHELKEYRREWELNEAGEGYEYLEAALEQLNNQEPPPKEDAERFIKKYSKILMAHPSGANTGSKKVKLTGETLKTLQQAMGPEGEKLFAEIDAALKEENPEGNLVAKSDDARNQYEVNYQGATIEVLLTTRVGVKDQDASISVRDRFVFDAKSKKFKGHSRLWQALPGKGEVAGVQSTVDKLNLQDTTSEETVKGFLGKTKFLFLGPSSSLFGPTPDIFYEDDPEEVKAAQESEAADEQKAKERLEAQVEGLEFINVVTQERAIQWVDKSQGILGDGEDADPEALKKTVVYLVSQAMEKLGPRNRDLLGALASLELTGMEARIRDKMVKDRMVQKISSIAEAANPADREFNYISMAKTGLLKREGLFGAGHFILKSIQEKSTDEKSKAKAGELLAYLEGGGKIGTMVEFTAPRFFKEVSNPAVLGAFAVAPIGGAYVEGLIGTGSMGRNLLATGMGILAEATTFTAAHKGGESLTHDPSRIWTQESFFEETAHAAMLFTGLRLIHGVTGFFSKKIARTRWGGMGEKAGEELVMTGFGRTASAIPAPPLSPMGKFVSGLMHHGGGIGGMWAVAKFNPFKPEASEFDPNREWFEAFTSYFQAMGGFMLVNGASNGWVAEMVSMKRHGKQFEMAMEAKGEKNPFDVGPQKKKTTTKKTTTKKTTTKKTSKKKSNKKRKSKAPVDPNKKATSDPEKTPTDSKAPRKPAELVSKKGKDSKFDPKIPIPIELEEPIGFSLREWIGGPILRPLRQFGRNMLAEYRATREWGEGHREYGDQKDVDHAALEGVNAALRYQGKEKDEAVSEHEAIGRAKDLEIAKQEGRVAGKEFRIREQAQEIRELGKEIIEITEQARVAKKDFERASQNLNDALEARDQALADVADKNATLTSMGKTVTSTLGKLQVAVLKMTRGEGDAATEAFEDISNQLGTLSNDVVRLERLNKNHVDAVKRLGNKLTALREKLAEAENKNIDLKDRAKSATEQAKAAIDRASGNQALLKQLRKTLDPKGELIKDDYSFLNIAQKITGMLNGLNVQRANLIQQLQKGFTDYDPAKMTPVEALNRLVKHLKRLETEGQEKSEKLDGAGRAISELKAMLDAVKSSSQEAGTKHGEVIEAKNAEIIQLKQNLADKEQKLKDETEKYTRWKSVANQDHRGAMDAKDKVHGEEKDGIKETYTSALKQKERGHLSELAGKDQLHQVAFAKQAIMAQEKIGKANQDKGTAEREAERFKNERDEKGRLLEIEKAKEPEWAQTLREKQQEVDDAKEALRQAEEAVVTIKDNSSDLEIELRNKISDLERDIDDFNENIIPGIKGHLTDALSGRIEAEGESNILRDQNISLRDQISQRDQVLADNKVILKDQTPDKFPTIGDTGLGRPPVFKGLMYGDILMDGEGRIIDAELSPWPFLPNKGTLETLPEASPGKTRIILEGDTVLFYDPKDLTSEQRSALEILSEGRNKYTGLDPYSVEVMLGKGEGPAANDMHFLIPEILAEGKSSAEPKGAMGIVVEASSGLLRLYVENAHSEQAFQAKKYLRSAPAENHKGRVEFHFKGRREDGRFDELVYRIDDAPYETDRNVEKMLAWFGKFYADKVVREKENEPPVPPRGAPPSGGEPVVSLPKPKPPPKKKPPAEKPTERPAPEGEIVIEEFEVIDGEEDPPDQRKTNLPGELSPYVPPESKKPSIPPAEPEAPPSEVEVPKGSGEPEPDTSEAPPPPSPIEILERQTKAVEEETVVLPLPSEAPKAPEKKGPPPLPKRGKVAKKSGPPPLPQSGDAAKKSGSRFIPKPRKRAPAKVEVLEEVEEISSTDLIEVAEPPKTEAAPKAPVAEAKAVTAPTEMELLQGPRDSDGKPLKFHRKIPGFGELAGVTDQGRNYSDGLKAEDAIGYRVLPDGSVLSIVGDGMGGYEGGNLAAKLAVETILDRVAQGDSLEMAVTEAHKQIVSQLHPGAVEGEEPGACLTAARFFPPSEGQSKWTMEVASAGDVVLTLSRPDANGQLQWVYQSLEESQRAQAVDRFKLFDSQGRGRTLIGNIIGPNDKLPTIDSRFVSNGLGLDNFNVKLTEHGFIRDPSAEGGFRSATGLHRIIVEPGDVLLIESDGVKQNWGHYSNKLGLMQGLKTADAMADGLYEHTDFRQRMLEEADHTIGGLHDFKYLGTDTKYTVDNEGRVYDANGQFVDGFRNDNTGFMIGVLEVPPAEAKDSSGEAPVSTSKVRKKPPLPPRAKTEVLTEVLPPQTPAWELDSASENKIGTGHGATVVISSQEPLFTGAPISMYQAGGNWRLHNYLAKTSISLGDQRIPPSGSADVKDGDLLRVGSEVFNVHIWEDSKASVLAKPYQFTILSNGGPKTLGRESKEGLNIWDALTSGKHAQIKYEDGVFKIEDMGSTNGTYLGPIKLKAHEAVPIPKGSKIQIGRIGLQVSLDRNQGSGVETLRLLQVVPAGPGEAEAIPLVKKPPAKPPRVSLSPRKDPIKVLPPQGNPHPQRITQFKGTIEPGAIDGVFYWGEAQHYEIRTGGPLADVGFFPKGRKGRIIYDLGFPGVRGEMIRVGKQFIIVNKSTLLKKNSIKVERLDGTETTLTKDGQSAELQHNDRVTVNGKLKMIVSLE